MEAKIEDNGYDDDPVLRDDDDPEVQEETFETFNFMKLKPEDIRDPEYRRLYAEWLKKQEK